MTTIPQPAKLVMLMEDDDDIARLVAHHLESGGFRIHRPARPYSLISDAETDRPALFILDLMLPEVDGFQLCRSIRAYPSLRDIPILILRREPQQGTENGRWKAAQMSISPSPSKPLR